MAALEGHVQAKNNTGSVQRSLVTENDAFFVQWLCLSMGSSQILGPLFHIKSSTFEKGVTQFLQFTVHFLYDDSVTEVRNIYSMELVMHEKRIFAVFKEDQNAINVTFQQAHSPSRSIEEGKRYYGGNEKLYSYEFGVSVLSNGLLLDSTLQYPRAVPGL